MVGHIETYAAGPRCFCGAVVEPYKNGIYRCPNYKETEKLMTCTCSEGWKAARTTAIKEHEIGCAFFGKSVLPENQGKRTIKRPRHDLIPLEFLDELASIFEEGLPKYGDSWKKGGQEFLTDCLNHASNHLHLYMNGDKSENQLAKVAWNVLAVRWHDLKGSKNEMATKSNH